ncbi:MAG: SEC-C domain-containing protein, partial [Phycisphaerales bacterium]
MDTTSAVVKGVKGLPRKIFGTRNDRLLKVYRRRVEPTNTLEDEIRGDFDERLPTRLADERIDEVPEEEREALRRKIRRELSADLLERTERLRERTREIMEPLHQWWQSLDPAHRLEEYYRDEYRKRNAKLTEMLDQAGIMNEAFAVLREASRRAQNHRHFDCQLIGGRVLFEGKIAEMKTGEGKTIVCHLAALVNVLCGRKIHIITVNDYLVRRDADFAAPIFELVDITVGYIQAQVDPGGREGIRHRAYGCDITYGTNSEFGFDYLRDNMKTRWEEQVQGRLDYVIVDEVDSILIDEARTPLIISGPAYDDVTRYPRAAKVAEELVRRQVVWDRKVTATVAKFDGDTQNIQKLEDAMNILGYKEKRARGSKSGVTPAAAEEDDGQTTEAKEAPTLALGPDFLTDDQVEAVQIYENDVLRLPLSEQYRRHFIVQKERKQVGLTHEGVTIAQELLDIGSLYSGTNMEWPHLIENALRAQKVYLRDTDYVVQDGQIIIVDPFTGRLMHGRQWSDGLHQAVEAKERVTVKEETQTLATITIQNFIKLYPLRAGMTGTALTEATEFDKIYRLDVVEIPTNRPVNRLDHNDKMYRDVEQKYGAIVEEIHEVHRRGRPADPFLIADVLTAMRSIITEQGEDTSLIDEALRRFNAAELNDKAVTRTLLETYDEVMGDLARGRPILVGTTSVENSEKLSKLLTHRYGIEHEVLNAKNHAREADIVAKAGHCSVPPKGGDKTPRGNVTIATNMAGRGTDIKLGSGVVYETCKVPATLPEGVKPSKLYPSGVTKCCILCDDYDPETNCAHCFKPKLDPRFPALGRKVCTINVPCGLHIIGTERHEARRIDNQLRGRSGRQGDPGSSRFSLSLQDDLLKLFMPDWMLKMMEKLGFTEGTSLEDKRLTKGIERAQRKVEERNFSTRKHLLEWDEPMDYQRKEFYSARQRILEERDLPGLIFETTDNAVHTTLNQYLSGTYHRTCIVEWCRTNLDVTIAEDSINDEDLETAQGSIRQKAKDEARDQIRTSLGEYIDPEEPPKQWDLGGLLQWARRAFKVSMTQNQLRKMEPSEIEDALCEAADALYAEANLDGIAIYLDHHYPYRALAEWGRGKFNIKIDADELVETPKEQIAELLHQRVREAYREREICYPIEWCLELAFGTEGTDHAAAAEAVVQWANRKYNLGWTLDNVQGKSPHELRETLTSLSREFSNGPLEQEIDRNISGKEREAAVEWAKKRFAPAWNQQRFERSDGDLRAALLAQGREMLRWELTRLEQFVLLRLYDQAWKDHLLEMDHLKSAIMQRPLGGDQTHPQSQFAIEGRDLFSQMWARIADRVTDVIFKVKVTTEPGEEGAVADRARRLVGMAFRHSDSTGAGFTGTSADQEAAMRAQNVEQKVETIRREKPKVGRNAPCPCGSGKKFKQCHGR